jgi:hypothetical protein
MLCLGDTFRPMPKQCFRTLVADGGFFRWLQRMTWLNSTLQSAFDNLQLAATRLTVTCLHSDQGLADVTTAYQGVSIRPNGGPALKRGEKGSLTVTSAAIDEAVDIHIAMSRSFSMTLAIACKGLGTPCRKIWLGTCGPGV